MDLVVRLVKPEDAWFVVEIPEEIVVYTDDCLVVVPIPNNFVNK